MLNYFRRLQWKLTLSYAFVTVGTVIVLTVLFIAVAIYFETQNSSRTYDSFYCSKTGFQDNILYLLEDTEVLQDWLERVQEAGFAWEDFQFAAVRETLDYANALIEKTEPIYVLDPDFNLIAAAPLEDGFLIGKPFQPQAASGLTMEAILDAARVGDKNYYAQGVAYSDGIYLVAFPLRKSNSQPVSAIVIYRLKPVMFASPANPQLYQTFFLLTVIAMLLVALPVGAMFGWLVSHGVRRRLLSLSAASQAWTQGDFSASPHDRSDDEIGELTRNLTGMAEQLQTLLHTRDELARMQERNRLARDRMIRSNSRPMPPVCSSPPSGICSVPIPGRSRAHR